MSYLNDLCDMALYMVLIPRADIVPGSPTRARMEVLVGTPTRCDTVPMFFLSRESAMAAAKQAGDMAVVVAVQGFLIKQNDLGSAA